MGTHNYIQLKYHKELCFGMKTKWLTSPPAITASSREKSVSMIFSKMRFQEMDVLGFCSENLHKVVNWCPICPRGYCSLHKFWYFWFHAIAIWSVHMNPRYCRTRLATNWLLAPRTDPNEVLSIWVSSFSLHWSADFSSSIQSSSSSLDFRRWF